MILGGSRAQSEQIYRALAEAIVDGRGRFCSDAATITRLLKTEASYENCSRVAILAASPSSFRRAQVASLKLDEVEEMIPDICESALGMAMELRGCRASLLTTSIWHRLGGPMSSSVERDRGGEFPIFTYCIFEVLERCPEERSGVTLEDCPDYPLFTWCHEDGDLHPLRRPKAKCSRDHYAIDSFIQKLRGVSVLVFASDYLCRGSWPESAWFPQFLEADNVMLDAEFDPALPVRITVDSGVFTGAVFLQVRTASSGCCLHCDEQVNVFANYLAQGRTAEASALAISSFADELCGSARRRISTDSAGGTRNPVGPTVIAEYQRNGLVGKRDLLQWPKCHGCVTDGLGLIENLVRSADGNVRLIVHPRCKHLIAAMRSYARTRRAGQWMDYTADPQHPHEDPIDALRGGLNLMLREGLTPQQGFIRAKAECLLSS
jgi:hypothetical protein